jgi:hypothetical protein
MAEHYKAKLDFIKTQPCMYYRVALLTVTTKILPMAKCSIISIPPNVGTG